MVQNQKPELKIDVKENYILSLSSQLIQELLKDKTSNKNLIWATDNYEKYGKGYAKNDYIEIQYITGKNGNIIKPRVEKTKEEQQLRIQQKAEVFTPSGYVINKTI